MSVAASPIATLVADVVGSRAHPDRGALHDRLSEVLSATSAAHPALHAPAITVGDEFEATYRTVGAAVAAAFDLRLRLLPDVDVRVGLGFGEVTVLGAEAGAQDGPGWWDARAAIEHVAAAQQRAASRHLRTAFRSSHPQAPAPPAVNAALAAVDALLGELDARSVRLLRGLRAGASGAQLAEAEGISPSAVSQRINGRHLVVIDVALADLADV